MKNYMNKIKFLLTAFYVIFSFIAFSQDKKASFIAATYNIRYDAPADKQTGNSWDTRKEALTTLIKTHAFDIFGTQEGMFKQMIELKNLLPEYDYVSYPYGGKNDHHQGGIVYRRSVFQPLDAGVFWLSETPNVPSIGWDATDRRICHWAKFKHIPSGKVFYFFNAHFYWRNEEARTKSGELIVQKIKEIASNYPTICVGDFNSTADKPQIKVLKDLLNDAFDVSTNGRKGVINTNLGGGNFQSPPIDRIDYILLSKDIKVNDYTVYSDKYAYNRYPSDHLPVSCRVTF